MPDSKITALTALTAADPANDMIPIVDVSDTPPASGNTKRISINNILACSPSATLASATITGDLTVNTNVLKVDSTNDRVIVGHTSGASAFQVSNAGAAGFEVQPTGVNSAPAILSYNRSGAAWIQLTYGASSHVWQNSGTDAMTLNSTGLGVGVSPSYRLHVQGTGSVLGMLATTNANGPYVIFQNSTANFGDIGSELAITGGGSAGNMTINSRLSSNLCLAVSDSVKMRIDSSGNVGIGVTPITSHILSCAGPVGITGTTAGTRTSYITNSSAASIYYTDGGGSGYFTDFGNLVIQPRTSAPRSVVIATGSTTPVERAVVKSTGQVRFVPLAADPAGAESGDVYYNSVSNRLKYYNGTAWTLI
jgi:hypothetical protein